jgi:hypothetical protein
VHRPNLEKKRSQDEHFSAFQQEMYRKHSDRLLRTVLLTVISLSLLWIFPARKPSAGRAAAIGLLLKTGSQLVCFSFSSDHIARSDSTQLISTQLVLKMFRTSRLSKNDGFSVELS